jgi:type I restriction enzyme M protein
MKRGGDQPVRSHCTRLSLSSPNTAHYKPRQLPVESQQGPQALSLEIHQDYVANPCGAWYQFCKFYLPDHARYSYLLNLPEDQDIAKAIEVAGG